MTSPQFSLRELREQIAEWVGTRKVSDAGPLPVFPDLLLALVEAVEAAHEWENALSDRDLARAEDRYRDALARFKDFGETV